MKFNQSEETIRVVILLGAPFTDQNFERIGIPYLSKHFNVIVFDCMEWMGRSQKDIEFKKKDWHYFSTVSSEADFSKRIEEFNPNYVINFLELGDITLSICKILARNNTRFVIVKTGTLPIAKASLRIKNMITSLLFQKNTPEVFDSLEGGADSTKRNGLAKLANKLLFRINLELKRVILVKRLSLLPNSVVLALSYKSLDRFIRRSDPIIWVCSNDYHTFNKVKKEMALRPTSQACEPFILFIDDCLANAHDWSLLDIPPPVTNNVYFSDLNDFFKKIESAYNIPVKIAGHPNSMLDKNYKSNMGGRSIIFNHTAELTIQSTIVLTHGSTATSFAVLAQKPIISLTTHELNQSSYGLHVKTMSKSLGTPLIFIDSDDDKMTDLSTVAVNKLKYHLYNVNYLCNECSNEKEPWGGFIEYASSNESKK
jgi:hypothetical protein